VGDSGASESAQLNQVEDQQKHLASNLEKRLLVTVLLLLLGKRVVTCRGGTRLLSDDPSGFRMAKPGEVEVSTIFQT